MKTLYRRFLQWVNRRFPAHPRCVTCGKPFDKPRRAAVCDRCNSDALRQW